MEHIRQFDWCYSQPDIYFLKEDDIAHSVTEKILRNKFRDPAISSESEEESVNINWDEIFTKKQNFEQFHRLFVPCLAQCPQYPKLSAIDGRQQYQCLKVLLVENPHILPEEFVPRPTKNDHRVFEELRSVYEKERKEYIDWAKTLWASNHCIRALHPKPHVETVYEASFRIRANEMQSYPKLYDMAAQIPLETNKNTFDMVLEKDLKSVNIKALPQIECRPITKKFSIIRPCSVPEPCNKHPCRFILPTEKSLSILPVTEVHRELAQYCLDSGAQCVAREGALRCLVRLDHAWDLAVAVVPVMGPDGETTNIVVLGSEFSVQKESVLTRTYRAFKHLLQHSLVPPSEKPKLQYKDPNESAELDTSEMNVTDDVEDSSDDEDNLCIVDLQAMLNSENESAQSKKQKAKNKNDKTKNVDQSKQMDDDGAGFYSCTCKDTIYERPPPRSYRKWLVRNKTTGENYKVVIHCSHKVRDKKGEVILEPIPEYQLDLGGSAQSRDALCSLALAMHLRRNASVINVRIDGDTGEVATFESMTAEQFRSKHGDVMGDVTNIVHTALSQLQGLLPGNYILRHEPGHGTNALLYVAKRSSQASLTLAFDCNRLRDGDETKCLKVPPTLVPVMLPFHKFRKILPCAFTPHEHQLPREPRRPLRHRQRTPPRALQWPKRKKKKNARNQGQ